MHLVLSIYAKIDKYKMQLLPIIYYQTTINESEAFSNFKIYLVRKPNVTFYVI